MSTKKKPAKKPTPKKPEPKRYAWGHRNLTIEEWVLEPDVWLRGIDVDVLRARLEPVVGEAWSIEKALLTPVANDEAESRAEDLVPKAEGRSKAARELNHVRKALLRLVALGGFVPLKDYRIAAALASDRHKLAPSPVSEVARYTFEVTEMSPPPIKGVPQAGWRVWTACDGINKHNTRDTVFTGSSSGQRLLQINAGTIDAEVLDAEAFPIGTRRMIITSQRFLAVPHEPR